MSRASVTTFGRGVSFVASGETGTQANEFEAAIKSVTSSTTVGAVFLYDTRNDSDGGAWRKKARGSWYYETLNTATRGGRREFPSVALIVADGASPDTVSLYDLDDPAAPLWLQFKRGTASWTAGNMGLTDNNVSSVFALNGRIYIGQAAGSALGVEEISFVDDTGYRYTASATAGGYYNGNISERLDGKGWAGSHSRGNIVNGVVNDVAATVLEGAEIGALGLPIPTIAVASAGGVSVIHPNGSVYDIGSIALNKVWFTAENRIGMSRSTTLSDLTVGPIVFADIAWSSYRSEPGVLYAYDGAAADFATVGTGVNAAVDGAIGQSNGLTVWKENLGNSEESLFAHITSTYNTGYMLGDIRFAGLANVLLNDRSVKANTLTQNGSITSAFVATDAELKAYSGWSASNYVSRAYDADFDFGTGDFSVMFWCKLADTVNATETVLERAYGGNALFNIDFASGVPRLIAYNGSAFDTTTGTRDLSDNQWHQLMCFRKSGVAYIYIDGKQHVSNAMTYDLDNSQAILHIGQTTGNGNPLANGSLSLLRISATAPTPTQVADIYEAEKPLFRAGAKCLIKGDSGVNTVKDLSYDKSTDLLSVGVIASAGVSGANMFRGLERVETFTGDDYDSAWSGNTVAKLSTAGGVSAYSRTTGTGGVIVDLPPFDVRGDTNIADTKLPDDGKLHFTAVTTDATKLKIPILPLAKNESATVDVKIKGQEYNTQDGEYLQARIVRTLGLLADGSLTYRPATYTIIDETTSSMDAELSAVGTSISAEVTGKAATRIVWHIEVEVQRISEKTYER